MGAGQTTLGSAARTEKNTLSVRLIISGASGYLLVGVLERALSLVTLPITTRLFSATDFGQLIAINNITAILNLFVGLFFIRSMTPLLAVLPDEGARRDAATTIFWTTVFLSVLSFSAIWLLAPVIGNVLNQPEGFSAILRLALVAVFVVSLGQALHALSRALERHALVFRVQSIALVGQTICVLCLLLIFGWGLASIFWAALAAGLIALLGYVPRLGGWLRGRPNFPHLGRATLMSANLLAVQFGTLLILNCSGLILNYVGRPKEAAAFIIANSAAGIGMLAAFAFDSVWTAHLMRHRNDQEIRRLAVRMFELHSVVFLIAGSAGALFAHEIFIVIVGPRFVPSYALVPPLIGCYALYSCARNFTQGIQLRARPRRSALIGCASAVLFLGIGIPAAYHFGAYGLLGAMATALFVHLVLSHIESFKTLPIRYPWEPHAALWCGTSAIVLILSYRDPTWSNAAFKVLALAAIAFIAIGRLLLAARGASISTDQPAKE